MANNNARQPIISQGPPGAQLVPAPQGAYFQGAQPTPPGINPGYRASAGWWTGGIQLGCGVVSIILGILNIFIYSWFSFVGTGIWTGFAFFTPAGILGLLSGKKYRCVIIAYMVMSILGSVAAGTAIVLYGCDFAASGHYYYNGSRVIVGLLLAIAAIELVTSIVAAAFCCAGTCSPSPGTTASVVYVYAAQPGGYAMHPGMMTFAPSGQQAPPNAPNGTSLIQQPFPMMQYPAGQPPTQWQPMASGGQPPVGQQAQNAPVGADGVAQAQPQAQAEEDKPPAYS